MTTTPQTPATDIQVDHLEAMTCPGCRKAIALNDLAPFTESQCPECNQVFTVPGRLGPYALLRVLNHNASGSTFEAIDRKAHRRVVVQVIKADRSDLELYRRFVMQARTLAALTHPNLVKILVVAEAKKQPLIVTDVVPGHRLSTVRGTEPWDERRVLKLGLGLADGLRLAQQLRVHHGDINADNILITDADDRAVLIDFGVELLHHHSEPGKVWGSPLYICPERVRGEEGSMHGDMYSLGAVMYHLLAGVPPFQGPSMRDTILARVHHDAPSLATHRPELSPNTVKVIDQMLHRDPASRPADFTALGAQFHAALASLGTPPLAAPVAAPVNSQPASAAYEPPASPRRVVRRRKKRSSLSLVIGIVMLVGIIALIVAITQAPGLPTNAPEDKAATIDKTPPAAKPAVAQPGAEPAAEPEAPAPEPMPAEPAPSEPAPSAEPAPTEPAPSEEPAPSSDE